MFSPFRMDHMHETLAQLIGPNGYLGYWQLILLLLLIVLIIVWVVMRKRG